MNSEIEQFINSNNFVFHGSPIEITVLEPRQAKSFNKETQTMEPHGELAVVATDDFEIAAFRALTVKLRGRSAFGMLDGKKYLKLSNKVIGDYLNQKGYVYVLDKNKFHKFNSFEWRSTEKIIPICKIEVDSSDIVCEINEIV